MLAVNVVRPEEKPLFGSDDARDVFPRAKGVIDTHCFGIYSKILRGLLSAGPSVCGKVFARDLAVMVRE
jgi:hypothetical protein